MAMEQNALDTGCAPSDFERAENCLVTPAVSAGRRRFHAEPSDFSMTTFGRGTVISAVPALHAEITERLLSAGSLTLYEPEKRALINDSLAKIGKHLYYDSIYYLPDPNFPQPATARVPGYQIQLYRDEEIRALYEISGNFPNALLRQENRTEGLRTDRIAAAAYAADGELAAMAGASDDSELFWQIGIDTAVPHRERGLASALVGLLTAEILAMGAIPYYGTWNANILSQNTARACGYFPAWCYMACS